MRAETRERRIAITIPAIAPLVIAGGLEGEEECVSNALVLEGDVSGSEKDGDEGLWED
jgi:hypothetical protein